MLSRFERKIRRNETEVTSLALRHASRISPPPSTNKQKMKTTRKSINSQPSIVTTPTLRTGLRRSALLRLAFIVNSLADSPSETDLPLPEVHAAAQDGRLLKLLAKYAGRHPDFSFLQSPAGSFDELNSALRDSSTILRGREFTKAGVKRNG